VGVATDRGGNAGFYCYGKREGYLKIEIGHVVAYRYENMSQETYIYVKRDPQKRRVHIWKETYKRDVNRYGKKPTKETCTYVKRDLQKRRVYIWIETYKLETEHLVVAAGTRICQKRRIYIWKETCTRDVYIWKETQWLFGLANGGLQCHTHTHTRVRTCQISEKDSFVRHAEKSPTKETYICVKVTHSRGLSSHITPNLRHTHTHTCSHTHTHTHYGGYTYTYTRTHTHSSIDSVANLVNAYWCFIAPTDALLHLFSQCFLWKQVQ